MPRLTRHLLLSLLALGAVRAQAGEWAPFADALVWQASEETSSVWASVIAPDLFTSTQTFAASQLEFDWNAGLRTGFEFAPEESLWDARVYWTYFPTVGTASIPSDLYIVMPESFSGTVTTTPPLIYTSGAIEWNLDYHTIDFEVGREIPLTETLSIRPSAGLKAAIINQSLATSWSDPLIGLHSFGNTEHDYWGLGPSFGVDGRWGFRLEGGLGLVGSFSGALMNGVWNVTDDFVRGAALGIPEESVSTTMHDSSLGTLMFRYFFGLEWTRPGNVSTSVHIGYETQWWANQQRITTFQQLPLHGDLTLQGASCGVTVCF